jgi:hypothetical protein
MANAMLLTDADPVFARESVRLDEEPSTVLGKDRLDGAASRCDSAPVPVRFAVRANAVSEDATETEPTRTPICEGLKVISSVHETEGPSWAPAAGQSPATE